MSSWTGDVDDEPDDEEEQENDVEISDFAKTFEKAVRGTGSPSDIDEIIYVNQIDEIDDEDLLREAWLQLEGERKNIVENRIEAIGGDTPESQTTSDDTSESDDKSDSGGWGGEPENEVAEKAEEAASDSKAAQPSVNSVEDMDEESPSAEDQTDSESTQAAQNRSGPPTPDSSLSLEEAANRDRRWKVLVWGPPKLFKTHFCYTMPEPIAFLDLEGKADDIAGKFTGKNIQLWQPKEMTAEPDTKFRRGLKALNEALEWLEWHRENKGQTGTIVVDSMSLMWEWAQIHHKLENYPLKDEDEVELSSNFNSSQESDWAVIKEYHNGEFREQITDSPYHFAWTAMERVDFEQTFDEDTASDVQIMEPTGEPKNVYKADTIIHARKDQDRGKVGDLTGSNFTDNVFVGLKKPTFPKVKNAINKIEEAESSDQEVDRSQLCNEIGAEAIIDHDPQLYTQ